MEYIVIPVKDKAENIFFLDLLKKMHKEVVSISDSKLEDIAFIAALKESEQSEKGSLANVKSHLLKVASGK